MGKFTFRKEPQETGLRGVGHPYADTAIKRNKARVGTIHAPSWQTSDGKWSVGLMVIDDSEHCGWRWLKFKARFDNEPLARDWLRKAQPEIEARYSLYENDF